MSDVDPRAAFDLDGRTDIGGSRSLSCRCQLALTGLDDLATGVLILEIGASIALHVAAYG